MLPQSGSKNKRWNQTKLGYFDPHFDRAHGKGEVVSVEKEVYYRNVVLFMQRIQSLVTIQRISLVKANIAIFLRGSAFKWYTSELSDFDRDRLNNNPRMKSWIDTFFNCFKMPTSVVLGFLTDKTYFFDNARTQYLLAQYVKAIMRHGISCNIVDVAN